jgi:hypothetical protein
MRAYSFDPFRYLSADECRAGSLRQLSPDVDLMTAVGRKADARDIATWKNIEKLRNQPFSSGTNA